MSYDGTPAHGTPRPPFDGTPARGTPRVPFDGTPAHGTPRVPGGGGPGARGGHPEQYEQGGGWGELKGVGGPGRPAAGDASIPHPRRSAAPPRAAGRPGPRQDYLDAFDERDASGGREDVDVFAPRARGAATTAAFGAAPYAPGGRGAGTGTLSPAGDGADDEPPTGPPAPAKGGRGRAFTGIGAAAVVTVLGIVVAVQMVQDRDTTTTAKAAAGQQYDARRATTGTVGVTASPSPSVSTLSYDQKMAAKYPLSAKLKGPGTFETVPGHAKAPGKGEKFTYRVDVENGLGLDGMLFAEAVQKTLNDDRSWSHDGKRTFERVDSGETDFVITLASPGTTAVWCAKSGLDTTEDNVSCNSSATERVMINAYRWAQGSTTYGDAMHTYRQMLINHEVGHRLGYEHVTCEKDGELAPVMQQQTKFLDHDGIHCLPNPWPYPKS
nr:DUF3152 domain-containing protein [Streptomyces mangrovisoli]